MYSKEIWIYASCYGVGVKYFTSFYTESTPYIDRIEPYLPTIFDSHFRQSPYFRVNIDFMWQIKDQANGTMADVRFDLRLNPDSIATIWINDVLKLEIPQSTGAKESVECDVFMTQPN